MKKGTLNKKIDDLEQRISKIEAIVFETTKHYKANNNENSKVQEFNYTELHKKTGLTKESIAEVIDIEDEKISILKVKSTNDEEKTKEIALLVILLNKYGFNKEYVLSTDIRKVVAENGISINNFGTFIKKMIPSNILRKGAATSNKLKYRLTVPGEVKAKKNLKELCGE